MSNSLISKILEYGDGKMKSNLCIFIASFVVFLFSWVIIFGIGGAIGISIGISFMILSLICSVFSGIFAIIIYFDWLENG